MLFKFSRFAAAHMLPLLPRSPNAFPEKAKRDSFRHFLSPYPLTKFSNECIIFENYSQIEGEATVAEYATEQKRILKQILEENSDRAYTVDELCDKLRARWGEEAPGRSTVYRLITHLAEDGTVKRFTREGSRRAAYQIVMGEHCDCHLHLKCLDCGKLIHLDEGTSDELLSRVRTKSNFSVSEEATVLFGRCGECNK